MKGDGRSQEEEKKSILNNILNYEPTKHLGLYIVPSFARLGYVGNKALTLVQ